MNLDLRPYYEDPAVVLYNADAFNVLPQLVEAGADFPLVLTDPPYGDQTHKGARTNRGERGGNVQVDFPPFDDATLLRAFALMGAVASGWVVATVDYHAMPMLEGYLPAAGDAAAKALKALQQVLRFVRFGVWVKDNPTPQLLGDRPGQGWEALAFMHSPTAKLKWSAGGASSVFRHPVVRKAVYPTEKPLGLVKDLISCFTVPGDLVLDPFCGSGTTLRAAKDLGRRAVGVEARKAACDLVVGKMRQEVLPLFDPSAEREG